MLHVSCLSCLCAIKHSHTYLYICANSSYMLYICFLYTSIPCILLVLYIPFLCCHGYRVYPTQQPRWEICVGSHHRMSPPTRTAGTTCHSTPGSSVPYVRSIMRRPSRWRGPRTACTSTYGHPSSTRITLWRLWCIYTEAGSWEALGTNGVCILHLHSTYKTMSGIMVICHV